MVGKTWTEVKKMKRYLVSLCLLGMILGVSRGYVAIWKDEDPQPWLVTKMPAALLPERDREALKKGIPLPNDEALTKALEDYCS